MRRFLPLLVAAAASLGAAAAMLAPAQAVSHGEPDAGRHPIVGVMVAQDEDREPLWRCSGTLVSPTVFVTAGHCTSNEEGGSVPHVQVWFDDGPIETDQDFLADVDGLWCEDDGSGVRYGGYPCSGDAGAAEVRTHPQYDPSEFHMHDLGVVVLDEAALPGDTDFATLPEQGAYDSWKSNRKQTFTAVGYGVQKDHGQGAEWRNVAVNQRMVSHPRLVSVNSPSVGDHAFKLSGNAKTGGTCAGDSGGPNFLAGTLQIAAVTSYGVNGQTCSGLDGAYRLDGADDVAFLSQWATSGPPAQQ